MLKTPKWLWAAPIALLVMAGCNIEAGNNIAVARPLLKDKIGKECTIQFRRDALGAATEIPVPVNSDQHNGAQLSISGRLKIYNQDGAMLEHDSMQSWIPAESILLIRFP